MNDLKIFENEAFGAVRVVEVNGEPWFVASDVARALKYSESSLETIGKLFVSVPVEWTDRKQIPVRSENGVEHCASCSSSPNRVFLSWPFGQARRIALSKVDRW